MSTAYKIYATVVTERLRREVEEKKMIPEGQVGFMRGRGVIENIYVLNYLIGRKIERGKEMIAVFLDLKAAFDSVDRGGVGEEHERKRDK